MEDKRTGEPPVSTAGFDFSTKSLRDNGLLRSVGLDVGCQDHLAPFHGLVGNKPGEIGRRARQHGRAEIGEPRLETFFIAACVAIGDIEGKPFSVAKIASYMHVPRTTVIRRLSRLQSWGLIDRRGRSYYLRERTLNSLIGMRSYQQVRRILSEATKELTVLDTFPG